MIKRLKTIIMTVLVVWSPSVLEIFDSSGISISSSDIYNSSSEPVDSELSSE
jgi:hypothetical protein